jgi:hypothetical protein
LVLLSSTRKHARALQRERKIRISETRAKTIQTAARRVARSLLRMPLKLGHHKRVVVPGHHKTYGSASRAMYRNHPAASLYEHLRAPRSRGLEKKHLGKSCNADEWHPLDHPLQHR